MEFASCYFTVLAGPVSTLPFLIITEKSMIDIQTLSLINDKFAPVLERCKCAIYRSEGSLSTHESIAAPTQSIATRVVEPSIVRFV